MNNKGLRRIFSLFTGGLLGRPKLIPKTQAHQETQIPHVRRVLRSTKQKQRKAFRKRQKAARRVTRSYMK